VPFCPLETTAASFAARRRRYLQPYSVRACLESTMSMGILYDATLCIGCKQCEQACAAENGLPYDDEIADRT
jgi:Fe-S-cluster-containing hydrogenase component 2